MEFDRPRRPPPTINLSALIDVLFILLIFIMVAANFDHRLALEVDLPAGGSPTAVVKGSSTLILKADGTTLLDDQPVVAGTLERRLEEASTDHKSLLIVSDKTVPIDRATRVLSAARNAGFTSASIETRGDRR